MVNFLTEYKALSSGADLWIVPYDPSAFWFQKINWHLKFLAHSRKNENITQPLLISTNKNLKNKQTLFIPWEGTNWEQACYEYWKSLNRPSLRVFIPTNSKKDQFISNWPEPHPPAQLSLIDVNKKQLKKNYERIQ